MLVKVAGLSGLLMIGLIAGFFYAWVCSTMWGLDSIDPLTSIKAMNGMNASVRNPVFFPVFFLTPVVLIVAGIVLWFSGLKASSVAFVGAAVIYVVGALLPTALVNVPMNRALELVNVASLNSEAGAVWEAYSIDWQWWNQVRALASGFAFLLAGWGVMKFPA